VLLTTAGFAAKFEALQHRIALPHVAFEVLRWVPFLALLTLAALCAVPAELHEAAAVDRAGPRLRLRRITLPLIAPLLLLGVAYRAAELLGARRTPAVWAYGALIGAIVIGAIVAYFADRARSRR
jgi:ABC-type sugar transport system permease subunit